jgi:hypothetical protein
MKRLAFAACLMAASLTMSSLARADYAIVQFSDGFCQVWWDSAGNPWGAGWAKLSIGIPDYDVARATLEGAIMQGTCR